MLLCGYLMILMILFVTMFYKLVFALGLRSCVDLLVRTVRVSSVHVARQQVCHGVYL